MEVVNRQGNNITLDIGDKIAITSHSNPDFWEYGEVVRIDKRTARIKVKSQIEKNVREALGVEEFEEKDVLSKDLMLM